MKKRTIVAGILLLCSMLLFGCFGEKTTEEEKAALPDGVYTADFDTDNSMFRVNEANEGKGILTVEDGRMTIHVSLGSKNIVNLYPGLAEDAKKEGVKLLMPTEDSVTYSDGWTEEVYGFDIPVPVLEEEFDVALIGKKGKWYDHKVKVTNVQPMMDEEQTISTESIEDGTYSVDLTFSGGSGRAKILSPAKLTVKGGKCIATMEWSSPYYDYMIVDGEKYLPINTEGNSVFEIPVLNMDEEMEVIGDTVAMSTPHEISYTITFHSDSLTPLILEKSMELEYAQNFTVDYYEGGYTMLTIVPEETKILIVPEDGTVPKGLSEDVIVLKRPVKDIYLVASAVMDMFSELDALDTISFSGQKEENWYIEEAKEAMAEGRILYAGKYNKPDYESIVANGCSLAIENRMITHSPEVAEKLEDFGIPVIIEYSGYEPHPLGRVEWIRFFGALTGKEKEAEAIFNEQKKIVDAVSADEKTDRTMAFFFVTSNGLIQVRQSTDYVPKMIELAGGKYIFDGLSDPQTKRSTVNMQVEEFYNGAKDADYLIYNSSIDGGVISVEELLDKCPFLSDFKAVKEGNVWCTTNNMYQQSLSIGYLIGDMHDMLLKKGEEEMHYLFQLK